MIQDPLTARRQNIPATENADLTLESFYLDGPVSERVAVVDFDHRTGGLAPGARFLPPPSGRTLGRYVLADLRDLQARDLNQVSVFATVLKTMKMFEESDALGRPLEWAFNGPQLLIVPRAGVRTRAFYQRESHSLQFFFFPSRNPANLGQTIFSSLSQDIVAHETGHAILDGIAPDLYHALTPQSLGLHETVADLTALIMAFRSRRLCEPVLRQSHGEIRDSTAFSSIAEEYAQARDHLGRIGHLRSLANDKTLDPNDQSRDELGRPNLVSRRSPHELCQVLTGALYPLMVRLYEEKRDKLAQVGRSDLAVWIKALKIAADRFKRMMFRALDYLPPGEVSFADYGRAILASDEASYPADDGSRHWIREEFRRRHIVEHGSELAIRTRFEHPALDGLDLERLIESDWAAYELANGHRDLLGIPEKIHFRVRPRQKVTKTYFHTNGPQEVTECLFKVSWDHQEENPRDGGVPARRQITCGTTMAIDWETRRIRALLTSDRSDRQRQDRDQMLARMIEEGSLRPEREIARIETSGDLMRIRRSATLLHLAEEAPSADAAEPPGLPRLTPPAGVDAKSFFNLVRWRQRLQSGAPAPPLGT
jgi:hypothetical protein